MVTCNSPLLDAQTIQDYTFAHDNQTIHLIDTPGFDNTVKSDTEILKDIAFYLASSYGNVSLLTGIIYLHSITAVRVPSTVLRNLQLLRKLCRRGSMSSIIMATTMWDLVSASDGDGREAKFKTTTGFWGHMIREGSRVMRHTNDRNSALRIIDNLLGRNTTVVLDLQKEMLNEVKLLENTATGRGQDIGDWVKRRHLTEQDLESTHMLMKEAIAGNNKLLNEATGTGL